MKYFPMLFAGLMIFTGQLIAEPVGFEDAQQQQRFQSLLEEIRCLVCQNQSLADSNAELARDLRNEVYRMVDQGESDKEIIDFLVARYGDFVLYRPPMKNSTLILWFGPFILLLLGLVAIYRFVKSTRVEEVTVSESQQQRLSQLLGHNSKD
jgi:cytochrome c-type biogenesis protein CcmH